MTTKFRRVQVTLTPDVDVALARLSTALKQPQGTVARMMLSETVPTMNDLAAALEGIDIGEGEVRARLMGWARRMQQQAFSFQSEDGTSPPETRLGRELGDDMGHQEGAQ